MKKSKPSNPNKKKQIKKSTWNSELAMNLCGNDAMCNLFENRAL